MNQRVFIILAAGFVLAATLWAAGQGESATISGKITDPQGNPVVGATVAFQGANTGASFSVKTDKKGEFLRVGVKEDVYHVTVTKDGQQIGERASYPVSYSSNPTPLTITTGPPSGAPAASAPLTLPVSSVPLTPVQQKALDELNKLAASTPKKDDKGVKDKLAAAQAAQGAGNFDQAATILAEITTAFPLNDQAWALTGFGLAKMGKWDEAVAALEKAVALKSGAAGYHQLLGVAYSHAGKIDEAVAEMNSAALADPTKAAQYYFYGGVLLSDQKQPQQAVAAFDKAIAANPSFADPYYFKGVNLVAQAKTENGKLVAPAGTAEAFKKYLELDPNGKYAASAKAQLGRVGG
ncbi:MAG TPA: carboxypeptidase regulatory-like domain-containing protein [Terriglobales bacterium]|nr:carboxypeptidase regulatory-like domain-containing protein [Terriglobales bacterium]